MTWDGCSFASHRAPSASLAAAWQLGLLGVVLPAKASLWVLMLMQHAPTLVIDIIHSKGR